MLLRKKSTEDDRTQLVQEEEEEGQQQPVAVDFLSHTSLRNKDKGEEVEDPYDVFLSKQVFSLSVIVDGEPSGHGKVKGRGHNRFSQWCVTDDAKKRHERDPSGNTGSEKWGYQGVEKCVEPATSIDEALEAIQAESEKFAFAFKPLSRINGGTEDDDGPGDKDEASLVLRVGAGHSHRRVGSPAGILVLAKDYDAREHLDSELETAPESSGVVRPVKAVEKTQKTVRCLTVTDPEIKNWDDPGHVVQALFGKMEANRLSVVSVAALRPHECARWRFVPKEYDAYADAHKSLGWWSPEDGGRSVWAVKLELPELFTGGGEKNYQEGFCLDT
eukprot:g8920.t1